MQPHLPCKPGEDVNLSAAGFRQYIKIELELVHTRSRTTRRHSVKWDRLRPEQLEIQSSQQGKNSLESSFSLPFSWF